MTNLEPIVLFRANLAEQEEMDICRKHFKIIERRSLVPPNSLIIPRYSALPFYEEFEADVKEMGGQLINSYKEHCYVANLRNWYYDLADYTPRTWFYMDHLPKDGGPFVLKGQTNSKKHAWSSMMYCNTFQEAMEVFSKLTNDGYVGHQQIYAREYIPLHTYFIGLNGLPITEEYRFFVLDGQIISSGFYWSSHLDEIRALGHEPDVSGVPQGFINKIIRIISPSIRFFVVDVARKANGDWLVIELNDGSQSGLSCNDPDILYKNMKNILMCP